MHPLLGHFVSVAPALRDHSVLALPKGGQNFSQRRSPGQPTMAKALPLVGRVRIG
jgi:hypothetical protein